jgi:hypothetical protein
MSAQNIQVSVVIDDFATEEQSGRLQEIFGQAGIQPAIDASYRATDSENAVWSGSRRKAFRTDTAGSFSFRRAWTVLIFTDVNALASQLGATALKELTGKLWTARTTQTGARGNDGLVMLVDEETGIRVALERDLPDDAYDLLTDVDMRAFRSDPLQFFRDRGRHGRWRSPDNVSGTG